MSKIRRSNIYYLISIFLLMILTVIGFLSRSTVILSSMNVFFLAISIVMASIYVIVRVIKNRYYNSHKQK